MAYKRNCRSCQISRGNQKLRERIYHAEFLRETGDETLAQIAPEMGVSYSSLKNHATKHIKLRSVASEEVRVTKNIEKIKAKIAKDTELSFDHESIVPKQDFEMVVDGVLAEGYQQLKKQDKQISISQLLTAAKIKADYTSKKRGQDTEIIKTMYRMASGGKDTNSDKVTSGASTSGAKADVDSTRTAPRVDNSGSDRPGSIHQQSPWDALAPGTNPIPA